MKSSRLKQQSSAVAVFETIGVVIATGTSLMVQTEGGHYRARRAISCLLECEVGDQVLLCVAGAGDAYILAVLERDEPRAATLAVAGDLNFHLPNGTLNFNAAGGMTLTSPKALSLTASQFSIGAVKGEMIVDDFSFLGRAFGARLETVTVAAHMISSTLGTLYERISRVFRRVEGLEHIQAGRLELQAKDSLSLHARNSMMTADQLVKVDGAQIHLG